MNFLALARTRVTAIRRGDSVRDDIAAELRFHIAMRTQENISGGMPAAEAARAAMRQFGNLNSIKDSCHDVSGGGVLEAIWQDLRFAVRTLRKDPAFTAVVLLVLAVSIGAHTAIFTVASSVLLRPLPFHEPERIISIWSGDAERPGRRMHVSYPDFQDFRERQRWFEDLGVYASINFIVNTPDQSATRVAGAYVSANVLALLGVDAVAGRSFQPADDEPGSRAALISYEMWQERYRGSPMAIGAPLTVNGLEHSIVGVMPEGFRFPVHNVPAQVWTTVARAREPLRDGGRSSAEMRHHHCWLVLGRLRPGVHVSDARAGMNGIAADLARVHPVSNSRFSHCVVTPLLADLTDEVRPALLLLLGAAACVLAIGCANLANLAGAGEHTAEGIHHAGRAWRGEAADRKATPH
jgi:hypothetical protein